MRLKFASLSVCASLLITAAVADETASYKDLWDRVSANPDCKASQFPDFTLFDCEKAMALWCFTKPNHPASPGVIERKIEQGKEGVSVNEQGWSFASDSGQPAFQAWMAQIKALDERARQQLQQHTSGGR